MNNYKITKENFKKLFKFFSLILFIDYPILPFFLATINEESCDYELPICVVVTLTFFLVVFFFWCMIWFINYAIFFMDREVNKKAKHKLSLPIYHYVKYLQNSFKVGSFQGTIPVLILVFACLGVLYLFGYELFALLKLLNI